MNWARHFGHSRPTCPAKTGRDQNQIVRDARNYVTLHRWWFIGGTLFGLTLVTVLVLALTGNLNEMPDRFRRWTR